ncbi:hypothetical protein Scep_016634 [Stephania cephalantha]|uniref:Mediator complex subunit 15 KIX domain-containing protein n=1 Tax=Stephania cephalantha TaxID=152367 RepID=A0AAP0NW45_9MAGN
METLSGRLPIYGPEGLIELRSIAVRFEEKIVNSTSSKLFRLLRLWGALVLIFERGRRDQLEGLRTQKKGFLSLSFLLLQHSNFQGSKLQLQGKYLR